MAAASGFSVGEIVGVGMMRKTRRTVPIKYRNPKDATQTWTGRGRPPRWLADAMKKGARKESYLV